MKRILFLFQKHITELLIDFFHFVVWNDCECILQWTYEESCRPSCTRDSHMKPGPTM